MNKYLIKMQVVIIAGIFMWADAAQAQALFATRKDFGGVARNITESIEELPGLVSAFSYMVGLVFGVLGVMKLKDHVEAPDKTPLKDGAIRLAAGGALFALPIVFEAMLNTIGTTGASVHAATVPKAEFNVR